MFLLFTFQCFSISLHFPVSFFFPFVFFLRFSRQRLSEGLFKKMQIDNVCRMYMLMVNIVKNYTFYIFPSYICIFYVFTSYICTSYIWTSCNFFITRSSLSFNLSLFLSLFRPLGLFQTVSLCLFFWVFSLASSSFSLPIFPLPMGPGGGAIWF